MGKADEEVKRIEAKLIKKPWEIRAEALEMELSRLRDFCNDVALEVGKLKEKKSSGRKKSV